MSLPKWLQYVETFAPLILAATPLAPIIPFVISGIQTAEQIPDATGAQKLAIAQQLVADGVAATNAAAGHTEIDPALVNDMVTQGINTVVSVVNFKHSVEAEDAAEATPPVPPPAQ